MEEGKKEKDPQMTKSCLYGCQKNNLKSINKMEQIDKIPKAFRKKLILQICRLCEKQYRKGFQQGAHFHNKGLFTMNEVSDFRHDGSVQGYKTVVNPGFWSNKWNPNKIKPTKEVAYAPTNRIMVECRMDDMEELIKFLESIEFNEKGYRYKNRKFK